MPLGAARGGMDKAGEIAPAIAGLNRGHRSLPARRPDPAHNRLPAHAMLIHRPDLAGRSRMGRLNRRHLAHQVFLNASCSAAGQTGSCAGHSSAHADPASGRRAPAYARLPPARATWLVPPRSAAAPATSSLSDASNGSPVSLRLAHPTHACDEGAPLNRSRMPAYFSCP